MAFPPIDYQRAETLTSQQIETNIFMWNGYSMAAPLPERQKERLAELLAEKVRRDGLTESPDIGLMLSVIERFRDGA